MGNPAGVRRDFDALEKRRFQAIHLYERGENQSSIARQVKVVRQTVARWVQQYRAQGKSALREAGRAGFHSRLFAGTTQPRCLRPRIRRHLHQTERRFRLGCGNVSYERAPE